MLRIAAALRQIRREHAQHILYSLFNDESMESILSGIGPGEGCLVIICPAHT